MKGRILCKVLKENIVMFATMQQGETKIIKSSDEVLRKVIMSIDEPSELVNKFLDLVR